MIRVTRLNHEPFFVNADLIEFIEATPDTVLTLATGKKVVVCEKAEDIVAKIIAYKKQIFQGVPPILPEEGEV